MEHESREIEYPYKGTDEEGDKAAFAAAVQAIEARHLPYFIGRPGIFEDDAYEQLKHHFFFVVASGRVILLQAESSQLPPELVAEVQAAFRQLFAPPTA